MKVGPFVGALIVAAACSAEPDPDPQLKADLEAAAAGTIEMAPAGPGTAVVSGIEQVNRTQTRTTAPKPRTTVDSPTPRTQEASAASKEPAATVPTSRPAVQPAVQPAPPGGYKTVDEVIRNAPFPIKPVEKKKP